MSSQEKVNKSRLRKISPWFTTNEILEYLGISEKELMNKLELLQEGIHYKSSYAKKEQILWRIDLIEDILCFPIPPLEKEAMKNAIENKITCNK